MQYPLKSKILEIKRLKNALLSIFHGIFLQKSMSGQNQDEAIASSCLVLATALSFRLFGISLNHRLVRRSSRTASQIAAKLAHMEKWRDLGYARLALDQPDWCTVLFILLYGLCKGDI